MNIHFPPLLDKLFSYNPDLQRIGLVLTPDAKEDFNAWFNTANQDYNRNLYKFAQDKEGGIIALWNYQTIENTEDLLIVYLYKNQKAGIISDNFNDFLRLIGAGYQLADFVFHGKRTYFAELIDDDKESINEEMLHEEYIKWLSEECGLEPLLEITKFKNQVKKYTQQFEKWIAARVHQLPKIVALDD